MTVYDELELSEIIINQTVTLTSFESTTLLYPKVTDLLC
jgi:hypothetical protein